MNEAQKLGHLRVKNGIQTEAVVHSHLVKMGKRILLPTGHNPRYDLVMEDTDGHLYKIQCKTGRYIKGAVRFHTTSTSGAGEYKVDDFDFFAVYCAELDKVYMIPWTGQTKTSMSLRVDERVNPSGRPATFKANAKDYEI